MMLPPAEPHPDGYFDGEIYGSERPERRDEWRPTFQLTAQNGSAVVVYPGMIHDGALSCCGHLSPIACFLFHRLDVGPIGNRWK